MPEPALKISDVGAAKGGDAKREKFVKLAESRTVNAIRAIRIIGKLGNPSAYRYDESDVRKIVKALHAEIEAMKGRMTNSKRSDGVDFKL